MALTLSNTSARYSRKEDNAFLGGDGYILEYVHFCRIIFFISYKSVIYGV